MARKRMFDGEIVCQDSFLDLPKESMALYFLLGMEADDEGFIAPKKVMRMYGISEDSLKVLIAKNFIIPFKSGVVVITDWKRNNWLDSRRIQNTIYQEEKKLVTINEETKQYIPINPTESKCLADAKQMLRENRIEENRIEENRIEENSSSSSSVNNVLYNSNVEKIQQTILETIGTTNINNIKECVDYLDQLPIELIEYALKKTARISNPSWKYCIPILESYITKGFKSIDEAIADDLKHKAKNLNKEETEEEKIARKTKALEEAMKCK